MKADQPSRTAEAAFAVRALESQLPDGTRLFNDPAAARFLTPLNRVLMAMCAIAPPVRNLQVFSCDAPRALAVLHILRKLDLSEYMGPMLKRVFAPLGRIG